ncbi:MAG: pirin family protein, partial [Candidatus Hydrogenedentes bacterium]|nr:pirin family protein [Candidatus Hydrogenedentota bacterium]
GARAGPFVLNTREELAQAREDYQRGTFTGPPAKAGAGA